MVGHASDLQLARLPFREVYPEFPGGRTYTTLDIGLVEIDNISDWTSQIYGLDTPVGPIADLNEMNLGLQLIDHPVVAYGSHSGAYAAGSRRCSTDTSRWAATTTWPTC